MQNPSKEYLLLFNTITDLEQSLEELRERLVLVQCEAEELYLEEKDGEIAAGDSVEYGTTD